MTVYEALLGRRSIRKYVKGYEIPDDDITKILTAAMHAPSACNTRPWEFYVIKSEEAKAKVLSIHPYARHLETASAAILVCAKPDVQSSAAEGYFPQDCGAAVENILLSAFELGYGTCWCGIYPRDERVTLFKETFNLSSLPFGLITIGKADETPTKKGFYDESLVKYL